GVTLTVTNASGFDVNVQGGSAVVLDAGSVLGANSIRVNGGTLSTNIDLSFPAASDFELSGNGVLKVLGNRAFTIASMDGTNLQSGTVNLTAGSQLDVAADAITVVNGVTLEKDGAFGASNTIGSLTIESGGVVTHSQRLLAGLVLHVSGTLD